MFDYITLGPTPTGEDCQQVGSPEFSRVKEKEEMNRYIELLKKRFPQRNEFDGSFSIRGFNHDLGRYHEVIVTYLTGDIQAEKFALFVEANLPEKWTDEQVLTMEKKDYVKCDVCGDIVEKSEAIFGEEEDGSHVYFCLACK